MLRAFAGDWSRRRVATARSIPAPVLFAASSRPAFIADRAWRQILKAMSVRPTLRLQRVAAWRLFQPQLGQIEVPAHGPANPWADMSGGTMLVGALIIGQVRGKPAVAQSAWSMAFHDPALVDLLRYDITANPIEIMQAAHDALMGAPASLAADLLEAGVWTLPAGPGAFAIQFRGVLLSDSDTALLATAVQWIPAGELCSEQRLQAARISTPHTERMLGEKALLPALMRPAAPPFTLPGETAPVCDIPV